jgi:hypothetical protein
MQNSYFLNIEFYHGAIYVDGNFFSTGTYCLCDEESYSSFCSLIVCNIYIYIYQGVQFFTFLHHYFHSFIVRQTNEQSNFLRWSKETHVLSNQNPYGENELQNMDPFLINTTFVKKNII